MGKGVKFKSNVELCVFQCNASSKGDNYKDDSDDEVIIKGLPAAERRKRERIFVKQSF